MSEGYYQEDAKYSLKKKDREYLSEPAQPTLQGRVPKVSKDSRQYDGVRFFAPFLPKDKSIQVLGVGVAPTPEEASGLVEAQFGVEVPINPRLLKGPLYSILMDSLGRFSSLSAERFGYTTLIPWLLPKNRRFKPNSAEQAWAATALHEFIIEQQPECIVAFGKIAFDHLCSYKISADDARGGWFTYKDTSIPIYLADPVAVYITQPWTIDQLITDFREVNRFLGGGRGMMEEHIVEDYRDIRTLEQLEEVVRYWETNNIKRFSVDCEWAGTQYVDGRLRSIQFCWEAGKAVYLNFFDEHGEKHLGATLVPEGAGAVEMPVHPNQLVTAGDVYTDYESVGAILQRWLNQPGVTYMGHHFSADSPWMHHWLGLEVLGRCEFDLEFAAQTCNEYSKLGLEYMAMKYTTFGRYDMELVMWKRNNKMKEDDGYGKIPDSILVPYALKDVDVVWRCYQPVMDDLKRQNLVEYYRNFVLPFVTDTFFTFTTTGLHVDRHLFELTRAFFNWAYRALLEDFRNLLVTQADEKLTEFLELPPPLLAAASKLRGEGKTTQAITMLDTLAARLSPEKQKDWPAFRDHWAEVRSFNIRSAPQMRRWLFTVLGLQPVKTTANKDNGMPSMLWEKVLELPPKLQATLQPAVDKETIEILSEQDTTHSLIRLLAVSNVGNQCKGFLKEGDYDMEGELVQENGLAKFICSDNFIRGNFSLTETGRPRSWKPNILNLSKYHNKGVSRGIARILENPDNNPNFRLPAEFDDLFGTEEQRQGASADKLIKKQMPSVRSVVKAAPGWCFCESDYQTAEVRSLGFQSGDKQLLELILSPDDSFGSYKGKPVRLFYREQTPIAPEWRDPKFIMAVCEEGKEPVPITENELDRDDSGKILHPRFDMHWAVAEESQHKPREMMNSDRDRGAGKVTRFSGSYGATGATIDRRIEAVTGIKPEPGTGQKMLDALANSQPVATEFLNETAEKPKSGEELVAASGRIRHFPIHSSDLKGMPWRVRNSYLRAMGNEARNFYMQESVAATASRACQWLNGFFRRHNMKARTSVALYDALLTYCPLEERFVVEHAHQLFMCDINVWKYHGRYMNYPIDTDLLYRWSWKPTDDEKKDLHNPSFYPMDEKRQAYLIDELETVKKTFFTIQPDVLKRLNVI